MEQAERLGGGNMLKTSDLNMSEMKKVILKNIS